MNDSFDPYTEWLAIPLQRRPPNAYDLLGLTQYEEDDARIQAAFHERYAKVRVYEVGPKNSVAQRILGELSRAFHVLSDLAKKQVYDSQLNAASDALLIGATTSDQDETWKQVEQFLVRAGRHPSADLMEQAEQLAIAVDPKRGRLRFAQVALRRGLSPRTMREMLLGHASNNYLSICGNCFGFVKAPLPAPFTPVKIARDGSLVSSCLSAKISKGPFRSRLILETRDPTWKPIVPSGTMHLRGRRLVAAIAWTLILSAGIPCALLWGTPAIVALVVLVVALTVASVYLLFNRASGDGSTLDAVWQSMVPQILDRVPTASEASFLSGLALATAGSEGVSKRRDAVERLAVSSRDAIRDGKGDIDYFGRCHFLALSDALQDSSRRSQGILLFRELLKECLDGALPFRSLELATHKGNLFRQAPTSVTSVARLHALWCCIESNLTVADVMTLIENSPTCRALFRDDLKKDCEDVSYYFALFKNPTRHSSFLKSAFELTASGDFGAFQKHPQVLLQAMDESLIVELRRISFRGERLTDVPQLVVRKLSPGFELEVNGKRFEYDQDPTEMIGALKRACYWYFSILHKEAKVEMDRSGTDRLPPSLYGDLVTCTACKAILPFVPGEIVKPQPPKSAK